MSAIALVAALLLGAAAPLGAQEARTKIRISNSALSVTSLALLAAREWKLFQERGLDAEIILDVAGDHGAGDDFRRDRLFRRRRSRRGQRKS